MKVVVCIKQVPDTSEVRLDPKTNTLIREGVPSIINPDDRFAIETALQIKEINNAKVTVLTMGPPQAEIALREALAMGCDDAVHVSGREFGGSDTYATATILAAAIEKIGEYDLVLAGRQAIDGDTAQVGPQIAERLNIPQVSYVEGFKLEDDAIVVRRQFEDSVQVIRAKFPCLITVLSDLTESRYMTVGGVVDAFEKEIPVYQFEDLKDRFNPEWIGLKGSPTKVVKSFPKEAKGSGTKLTGLTTQEAVDVIVSKLSELQLI